MNPFEKKLVDRSKETIAHQEAIVNDVKLLLDNNAQEEIATLKAIGLDNDLKFAEQKKEDIVIRTKNGEKFSREIVTQSEIHKLCLDYRLYMKPAKKFVGVLPPELASELTRFCKEKKIVLTASSSYSNFYVIAPPRMFEGYKNPWQVFIGALLDAEKDRKERIRIRNADPILVYQLPDAPNYYAIIKAWGHDFAPLRRVYGFFTKRTMMTFVTWLTTLLVCAGVWEFASYLMDIAHTNNLEWIAEDPKGRKNENHFGWIALFGLEFVGAIAIICLLIFGDLFRDLRRHIRAKVTSENEYRTDK